MIYTSVTRFKSNLFYRYIDDNNIHQKEKISETELELFVRSNKNSDSVSLYGDSLIRRQFNSVYDMSNYIKESKQNQIELFGMQDPVYQFISNEYKDVINFDIKKINIFNFDIETRIPEDGTFDKPSSANQPIVSITCKLFNHDNYYVFGTNDYSSHENEIFVKCNNEKELLTEFINHFRSLNVDIITGWNVKLYDIVFLINRINKLLGIEYSNSLSPFSAYSKECIQKERGEEESYSILGITILDYLEVYKKFSLSKLDSYRLDRVAEFELKKNKLDYSQYKNLNELYDKDYQTFIEYNIKDCELVELIDKKLNFIMMILTVAYDGKINYSDVFSQTRFWHSKIYNVLKERNIQIPQKESHNHIQIPGGFVKDVQKGKHKWVCSFDLNSLYPNIIRMLNLSPETLSVEMGADIVEDFVHLRNKQSGDYCFAANSSKYRKDKLGIIPELLTIASDSRVKFKNEMLEVRKEVEQLKLENAATSTIRKLQDRVVMLDSLQNSKKVALNSVYGAMACPHFFLFNPSIASGITLTGQAIIKFIERRVNIFLNEKLKTNDKDFVILSDTDSIAIRLDELVQKIVPIEKQDDDTITDFIIAFGTKVLNPFIEQCFKEFEEYVNCYDSRLVMKLENIAKASICIAKKNYVMGVRYSEGTRYKEEKLKMMGISVARSSIPEFCKPAIINCIKICLYGTESELQDYIKEFETVYYKASPEEIAMPRSISDIDKWIIDETTWKTGTPIHVKCSIIYNHLIKKLKIANTNIPIVNGAKMKFVYVNEKNLFRNNAIAFTDKYPNEFHDIFEIDYSVMFNKGFLDPVKAFTEVLGWTDKKVFTLDAFF